MDRNKKTCLFLLLSVFLSTFVVYNIHAIVPVSDKRLIQVSTGEVFWMAQEEILELARKNHEQGRCGGFMDITEHPRNDVTSLQPFWMVNNLTPSYPETVNPLLAEVSPKLLQESIEKLSAFNTRYYKSDTGDLASQWIRDRILEYGKNNSSVTVELFQHVFKQPSVVAKILGKGPQSDEFVILGAHEDSINLWGNLIDVEDKRAPGADDDASGVATLLETFRVIVESGFQPHRTLV
ncbi:MAG: M28 family peptidase, partial [Bdellovibrio sp.]|nr:M28 family peptidase [Bdellovibrio sp.]